MDICVLGICGTFMGGLAILAKELGHNVTGIDKNIYPPMSTMLDKKGICINENYTLENFPAGNVIVGNVMTRGNPIIEALLSNKQPLISGPSWLANNILTKHWILAVSGTHGKTTTASMLTWILECAGLSPGFLIGGIPNNFGISARLGNSRYFVVEADEYDTAFFDKRAKFVHYRPDTLIINNLEFDHADIYPDIKAIQQQFHHLIRTIPKHGKIFYPFANKNIETVLKQGCWSDIETIGKNGDWYLNSENNGAIYYKGNKQAVLQLELPGEHNINNAMQAIAAANHIGIAPQLAIKSLQSFKGVKRRLEVIYKDSNNKHVVYDDFAHHPTAIKATVNAIKNKVGKNNRVIAVIDIRSNTMRMGIHKDNLSCSLAKADLVYILYDEDLNWSVSAIFAQRKLLGGFYTNIEKLINELLINLKANDTTILMSNGSFQGLKELLLQKLRLNNGVPVQ